MSNFAKPAFSRLLDGRSANGFDAKHVLAKRREARRELIPFTPLACFDLPFDEAQNGLRLRSDGPEPLMPAGAGDLKL